MTAHFRLSKLANLIYKWIPDDKKHDVLFYSTLLTKLIEGAHKVVSINMHLEELAYNTTLRNPEGFKLLLEIPAPIVSKGLDALADAERTQVFIGYNLLVVKPRCHYIK